MYRTYKEGDDPFILSGFLETRLMQERSLRVVVQGHTPLKSVTARNILKSERKDLDYFF